MVPRESQGEGERWIGEWGGEGEGRTGGQGLDVTLSWGGVLGSE